MLPPSRPSETTRAGSTSGLVWKRATREKKESCSSTPTMTITASRTKILGVTITFRPPGQDLDQVEVGEVGVGAQAHLLARLLLDDRGAGDFADRQVGREERGRGPGRASPR